MVSDRLPSSLGSHTVNYISVLLRNSQLAFGLLTRQRIRVYATNALLEGLGRAFSFTRGGRAQLHA